MLLHIWICTFVAEHIPTWEGSGVLDRFETNGACPII
jgi:hypothetical protein